MRTLSVVILVLLGTIFSLTGGCTTVPDENRGAATGAVIGAATGAMAGAVLAEEGSRTQGAIIGGLSGALLGSVIGSYSVDHQDGSDPRDDSLAGVKVRLREVSVEPAKVYPGERVDLRATYTIKAPRGSNPRVHVTEIREIRYKGDLVGDPEVRVTHTPGTYDSDVPLFLSRSARPGTYKVVTIIKTSEGSDTRESSFTVR